MDLNPYYPPETALILVSILPTPRDLEIARVLGWYRIRLKSAPKVIAVDYLAFYQTAAFGEAERWRIQYIAAVRGHELTTRRELLRDEPEHPRANEEYYKVQLGPLIKLPIPILAERWRRITFLYTTGEMLQRARTISDLVLPGENRPVLWRSLRERAAKLQPSSSDANLPEFLTDLDEATLEFLGVLGHLDTTSDS
jgi:hypothetical protein